jgi:hypothetical protein
MGWDEMGWDGMRWDEMGWDGMGWEDGTGYGTWGSDGLGWDGMGTHVRTSSQIKCPLKSNHIKSTPVKSSLHAHLGGCPGHGRALRFDGVRTLRYPSGIVCLKPREVGRARERSQAARHLTLRRRAAGREGAAVRVHMRRQRWRQMHRRRRDYPRG